ncbi:hypothetical protein C2I18_27235 [Paenibacillus sp. PK3_47]|uniref:methyl-accepting chemotaxis protein n=1 Tax=Paenibacillus sp. PK3_47 TaxID=2072642 RepID=UPI00201E5E86|nr:methyl-accepting chemotaxis protein [Paenibacillus sp. PK3_47]UQZ36903.1 hypothetical protein C2I18_27235 [Paenibacillus sp. PK3_47]
MSDLGKTSSEDLHVLQPETKSFIVKRWFLFMYNVWLDLSVRLKLYLMISICLVSFAVAMIYMVETGKRDINNLSTVLYSVTIRSSSDLLNADKDLQHMMFEHQKFVYTGGTAGSEASTASIEAVIQKTETARAELEKLGVMDNIYYKDTGKTLGLLFTELNTLLSEWSQEITKPAGSRPSEEILDGQFADIGAAIFKLTSSLESYSKVHIMAAEQEALRKERFGFIMLFLVVAATLILAAMTIRHIVITIHNANVKLTRVTKGDLTAAPDIIYPKDDLGQLSRSVDTTISDLRKIINLISANASITEQAMQNVVSGSQGASGKADNVVGSMESMSLSVKSQFTGITETSRSVEEMALGVNRIAASTAQIADHSSTMHASAALGVESISSLMSQMAGMLKVITTLETVILSLSSKSEHMNQIVSSITGFAEDSNLLSLNASLEAARAGEQGRGFLVVTAEMRRLSDHSRQAAREVSSILNDTVGDITEASALMHESIEETKRSNMSAHEVNTVFREIIDSVTSIMNQLLEASAVTEQMSASSEEVAATMNELSSAAESVSMMVNSVNSAASEQKGILSEVVQSSHNLKQVVAELRESVDSFSL